MSDDASHPTRPLADDTTREAEALQLAIWRSLPMHERFRLLGELCATARHLTELGIRKRHPLAGDDEVRMRLFATWLDRATMIRVYGWDPAEHGIAP
ncbi:MAG: hypothetical protein HZB39_20040 [Planctomycetes bacterium]|nr:hypothetical protein [Planctomycetota bacterium]